MCIGVRLISTSRLYSVSSRSSRSVARQQSKETPKGFEAPKVLKSTILPGRPVYLDLQATTPIDPRVLDAMLPVMSEQFGNPHSRTHYYGWEAEGLVEDAREHIAKILNADAKEIVYTSGATESNNMAIKGVVAFYGRFSSDSSEGGGAKKLLPHIITTQTEHKCVLDSCRNLEETGAASVTYLPVQSSGLIDLDELKKAVRPETVLVTIMTVNNEIGVIQPIAQIGKLLKDLNTSRNSRILFHTDAAQAVGKIKMDVEELGVDLLSISGHKLYGPKGVGALYVRRRPRVRLAPLITGGGQERGLRSGTVPAPLAVGLGEACRIALEQMNRDTLHMETLSNRLVQGITKQIDKVIRNGEPGNCYPGCVNLSFACVEGESLLMALKRLALSSGSACTSASLEPSYVLRALGREEDLAHSSIRFGLGRFTTEREVDFCVEETVKNVKRLRELSPLWEMVQEGIDLKTISWSQH
jgi:cysteine desulfurase